LPRGTCCGSPRAQQPTADLVVLALANNIELQQADVERQARADRLKGERGGYWPSIDLVSEYATLSKINNYDEFFQKFQRHNLNAGIQLRWSIFSAQTTSAVRLAHSELQLGEVELTRKREEVELTVRRESQRARELRATRDVAGLELKLGRRICGFYRNGLQRIGRTYARWRVRGWKKATNGSRSFRPTTRASKRSSSS
jgi:outer membrane protein TolC